MGQYDNYGPFRGYRFRLQFPIRDVDGALITGAAGLDSEYSADNTTFSDCTNEAVEIATNSGIYYLELDDDEIGISVTVVKVTSTTADAVPAVLVLRTKRLACLTSGTAQSGGSNTITLAAGSASEVGTYIGCYVGITGGTGAGQIRLIYLYDGPTKVATVTDSWTTQPDDTSVYELVVLLEGAVNNWGNMAIPGVSGSVAIPDVNIVQISEDETAADNLESYCDGGARIPVDVRAISEDETAADNLESYCDGGARMPVDVRAISEDVDAADNLELIAEQTRVVYAQTEDGILIASSSEIETVYNALAGILSSSITPFSPTVVDDFDRSNEGPPMTGWGDMEDGMKVISDQCAADAEDAMSYYDTALAANLVVDVAAEISTLPDDGESIFIFVSSSGSTFGVAIIVGRDDGGDDTITLTAMGPDICQATIDLVAGDWVGIRYAAGFSNVYHKAAGGDWCIVASGALPSPFAPAYAGVGASDTTARLDNFAISQHIGTTLADDAIDAAALASDVDTYQAKAWLIDDDTAGYDRYVCVWFKNSEPVTSGITSPTIQVIAAADGSDLVGETSMTQIAATGLYRYDENTNRVTSGATYIVCVTATIDGASRTWYQPVGRDA